MALYHGIGGWATTNGYSVHKTGPQQSHSEDRSRDASWRAGKVFPWEKLENTGSAIFEGINSKSIWHHREGHVSKRWENPPPTILLISAWDQMVSVPSITPDVLEEESWAQPQTTGNWFLYQQGLSFLTSESQEPQPAFISGCQDHPLPVENVPLPLSDTSFINCKYLRWLRGYLKRKGGLFWPQCVGGTG